jgi:Protein of unknown function (DUF2786)
MELNSVLTKVRGLIAVAEHPNTGEAEARTAREAADRLMLKYAVDEAMAEASRPADYAKAAPDTLTIDLCDWSDDITGYIAAMARRVAQHCRCLLRNYSGSSDGVYRSTAYGFTSDLRYFEFMYTTIRLHMLGALSPSIDPAASLEDNAYNLHEAGFNWLQIAEMYGWKKVRYSERIRREFERGQIDEDLFERYEAGKVELWYNEAQDEYQANTKVGSHFKRAYYRAVEARGEKPTKIAASGSKTYRLSAAQGYLNRISQRLYESERGRNAGEAGAVVLANRAQDLEDYFREANARDYTRCPACGRLSADPFDCDRCGFHIKDAPKVKPTKGRSYVYKETPFNDAAYRRGVAHANTADFNGTARAGSAAKKSIS